MCAGAECQQVQAGSDVSVSGRSGFRSGLHLWAIGITLIVVILLGCGTTIWDLHRQTIEQHLVAVSNLGVVLGEQTERYVQLVDRTLEDVQSRVAELGITSPDELTMALRTEATGNFLRERLANLPRDNAFTLLKADGRVLISTRAPRDMDLVGSRLFPPFRHARRSGAVHQRAAPEPCDRHTDRFHRAPDQWSGSHLPRSCGRSHRSWVSHRLLPGDQIAARRNRHPAAKRWARAGRGIPTPRTRSENGCRRRRLGISSSPGKAAPTAHLAFSLLSPRWYRCTSCAPGRWSSMSR